MTIQQDMSTAWDSDCESGDTIQSAWALDVNDTLDDKISQTETTDQSIAADLSFTNDAKVIKWSDCQIGRGAANQIDLGASDNLSVPGGAIYFGADVTLSRTTSNRLDLATGDSLYLSTTGTLFFGADASMGYGAANRIDLSAGDSLLIPTDGDIYFGTGITLGYGAASRVDLVGAGLQIDNDFAWKSGTANVASLEHANTGARAYTFPDVSGTVTLNSGNATQSRTMSIPAAAFQPIRNWTFAQDGAEIENTSGGSLEDTFAPVFLPNGAVVTAIRATIKGDGSNNTTVDLDQITRSTGANSNMGTVSRSTNSYGEVSDTSISPNTIDNDTYSYQVFLTHASSTGAGMRGVQIDYTVTVPYP